MSSAVLCAATDLILDPPDVLVLTARIMWFELAVDVNKEPKPKLKECLNPSAASSPLNSWDIDPVS